MKVLFLTRFGRQGASSRMRSYQFLPWFEAACVECAVSPLFSDGMLHKKYKNGGYPLLALLNAYRQRCMVLMSARQFDLVFIEKEALPWWPAWLERWMLRHVPYVLDFDDALFHNYDMHRFVLVRLFLGLRIDRLMAGAKLVIVGNRYLAARAVAAGAHRVEIVPTVIDLARYSPRQGGATPRIVWIGSPSTAQYLLELAEPLRLLAKQAPFTLRVIGAGDIKLMGVDVEPVLWEEGTEAARIAECDVGIMPLRNSPWEQGKCAYKLIQYMAAGLPTVSSPIGANLEVVVNGETGVFADSPDAWIIQLELLLRDAAMRKRMGAAGRARVESVYCLQRTTPRLVQLLKEAAGA
jgi:glycosyltransferase involved in cell wall biosynthesis